MNNEKLIILIFILFFKSLFSMNQDIKSKKYRAYNETQKIGEKIYDAVSRYNENKNNKEIFELFKDVDNLETEEFRLLKLKYLLIYACDFGIYDLVVLAMKLGANPNIHFDMQKQNCRSTPLCLASSCEKNWWEKHSKCYCGQDHEKILELLISSRGNLDLTDRWGFTPLILASLRANDEMVKSLLKSGADFKIKNKDGGTAQLLAKKKMDLLEKKIFECKIKQNNYGLNYFESIKEKYNRILAYLNGAVYIEKILLAIKTDNTKILKALLIKEPKIKDFSGNNILHISSKLHSISIFKYIFGLIPELVFEKNETFETPLDINKQMLIYLILHKKQLHKSFE